jgi:hypothetical protein
MLSVISPFVVLAFMYVENVGEHEKRAVLYNNAARMVAITDTRFSLCYLRHHSRYGDRDATRIRLRQCMIDRGRRPETSERPFENVLMRRLWRDSSLGCGPKRAAAGWLDLKSDRSATRPI